MARPLRINIPGAFYHVTVRGNEKKDIYYSDRDRNHFLDILSDTVGKRGWICHAYCLMNNHYHLLIETPKADLSQGMRDINSAYSQRFNRIHKRVGHLFQGRFHSSIIEKESYFLEAARYVVLNPVRALMVEKPEDWRWSSYLATIGAAKMHRLLKIDPLLMYFDDDIPKARRKYQQFILKGIGRKSPFDHNHHNVVGSGDFENKISDEAWKCWFDDEIPLAQRMIGRPSLKDIFGAKKMKKDTRNKMIVFACRGCGYTQTVVAKYINIHCSTVSKIVRNSQSET